MYQQAEMQVYLNCELPWTLLYSEIDSESNQSKRVKVSYGGLTLSDTFIFGVYGREVIELAMMIEGVENGKGKEVFVKWIEETWYCSVLYW